MENLETESTPQLVERIMASLMKKYSIEEIMRTVSRNRDKTVYVCVRRENPDSAKILVDHSCCHRYRCDSTLYIPIPKKFAVLEPDKLYFEMTLRANITLALTGARESELHP